MLDDKGDVDLEIEDSRVFVSTKVLGLASPVFASMFASKFKEGIQDRAREPASVRLQDDEALTMDIILCILHYRKAIGLGSVDAGTLASIAFHSD